MDAQLCEDELPVLLLGRREPGDAAKREGTSFQQQTRKKHEASDSPLRRAIFGGLDVAAGLTNLAREGSAALPFLKKMNKLKL